MKLVNMRATSRMGQAKAELRSFQVAAFAVFLLGGAERPVHTEDAALKAYELAPPRFSWKKHQESIDLEVVRLALRHAAEPQHGSLVHGSIRKGWMLTPAGIAWAESIAGEFEASLPSQARRSSRLATFQAEKERLRQTAAWRKFQAGHWESMSVHDFHLFARVNEYFSRSKYEERIAYLRNACADDSGLTDLIDYLAGRFGAEFK